MNPFEHCLGLHLNGKFYSGKDLNNLSKLPKSEGNSSEILNFAATLFNGSDKLIFHTSGSTGKPKEIEFSKEAVFQSAQATNEYFNLKRSKKALLALPLNYVAGKMMVARAIEGNYEIIAAEPTSTPLKSGMEIDFAPLTPFQLEQILEQQPELLSSNTTVLLGGSGISEKLRKMIFRVPNDVYLGFGMTETLTHFALSNLKIENSVFELLPDSEIKIDETGRLSVNRRGITRGWIKTNDIVEKQENGFIWKGRFNNVINSGGIKLHPEEIETILSSVISNPFFVCGLPDESLGEQCALFVEGNTKPILETVAFANKFMKPRKVILMKNFLRTDSGKIRRLDTVEKWRNS